MLVVAVLLRFGPISWGVQGEAEQSREDMAKDRFCVLVQLLVCVVSGSGSLFKLEFEYGQGTVFPTPPPLFSVPINPPPPLFPYSRSIDISLPSATLFYT